MKEFLWHKNLYFAQYKNALLSSPNSNKYSQVYETLRRFGERDDGEIRPISVGSFVLLEAPPPPGKGQPSCHSSEPHSVIWITLSYG